jgi:hypothetical protein
MGAEQEVPMPYREPVDNRSELVLRLATAGARVTAIRIGVPGISKAFALFRSPLAWWQPAHRIASKPARAAAHRAATDTRTRPAATLPPGTPDPRMACGRSGHGAASALSFLVQDRESSFHGDAESGDSTAPWSVLGPMSRSATDDLPIRPSGA